MQPTHLNMSTYAQQLDLPTEVDPHGMSHAFTTFCDAAASLEQSYGRLQAEVKSLRQELGATNQDLTLTLEENQKIRIHLKRILDWLACGVVVRESDCSISIANPEAQKLLGIQAHVAVPDAVNQLLEKLPMGASELEFESAGSKRCLGVRRTQLGAEDGSSAIFIVEDLTEWRRLQKEHEELKQKEALAQMSAILAHEVRNPLASMELFAGLLTNSSLPENCRPWIRHLQAGLRSLAATVNNVLQFHNSAKLEMVLVELGEFLDTLCEFLLPVAEQTGVAIVMTHQLRGVRVPGDPHAMKQVFLNLAMNAFRFMPLGGHLMISGGLQRGDVAQVTVADTGPGVAPDLAARVFEAGFTTRSGSAGLGLAVCKMVMDAHHGKISIGRHTPSGALVRLEFPGAQR